MIIYHDFRYTYLSGEVGLLPRLSARFLFTYLYGLEGPQVNEEKNVGFSDAWLGLKYALTRGDWPMALAATDRTPFLYDLPGAYNRYLYDAQGNRIRGVSPEWRGLLKHDYTLTYLLSHSYAGGRGWMNFEAGYTWREGAPADAGAGLRRGGLSPPWSGLTGKGTINYVRSLDNDSPRQPDDRFGASATNNFNDASYVEGRRGGDRPHRPQPRGLPRDRLQPVALGALGPALPRAVPVAGLAVLTIFVGRIC